MSLRFMFMTYIGMAYMVVAYSVMPYIVVAYSVMAYIVMARSKWPARSHVTYKHSFGHAHMRARGEKACMRPGVRASVCACI